MTAATPGGDPPYLAALPMYDWPELQPANDALWRAVAERLQAAGVSAAPKQLTRDQGLETLWTSPALLMAQTCGYPLMTSLKGRVRLLGAPHYRAPGCEGPFRRSAILVRATGRAEQLADLRGAICAVNEATSDSGMNLLRAAVATVAKGSPFFSNVLLTGSHLASAEAVAQGSADVAALDAVTYAHLQRLKPDLAGKLRLLRWSAATPGLPLISAKGLNDAVAGHLLDAIGGALADPDLAEVRGALLLLGFSPLPLSQYASVLYHQERAVALGYPDLR